MDEFIKQYKQINIKSVKSFLLALKKPCYESELLKTAFPQISISSTGPFSLTSPLQVAAARRQRLCRQLAATSESASFLISRRVSRSLRDRVGSGLSRAGS